MSLNDKQFKFVEMVALLINFATLEGYTLTFGDALAKSGHVENSFHYKALAIDLNLFKNGIYLKSTIDYTQLGIFWESIGGTWGGRFKNNPDGNHFSLGEGK